MTTPSKASEQKAASAAIPSGQIDAIELLTQDHANVKALFEQYDTLSDRSRANKKKVATQICLELTKHATAEEEIFYPAVRAATGDEDLVDEATVEHAAAKDLIAQIVAMNPDEDLYDGRCCNDIDLAEGSPSPAVSGSHSWNADGVWPSSMQHAIEDRHTDRRLRALAGQAARAQARTDDGLVTAHRRFDQ